MLTQLSAMEIPPHLDGGASRQTNYNAQNFSSESNKQQSNNNYTTNPWITGGSQTGSTTTDAMKQPGKGNNPS